MAPKTSDKVSIPLPLLLARSETVAHHRSRFDQQKPASTAGKAPASKAPAGKAPSAAKKAVKKTPAAYGEKNKKRKTRKETYSTYIYKVSLLIDERRRKRVISS